MSNMNDTNSKTFEKRRVPINSINTIDVADDEEIKTRSCFQRVCKWFIIITVIFVIVTLLIFIILFVVLPLIFMNSTSLQQKVVFHNHNITPENPEFGNFEKYGIQGARNLYVTVNDDPVMSLGIWHLLPEALIDSAINNQNFDYQQALADGKYPTILYFHDTDGHRITPTNTYQVLRKFFHVIAFDYRNYGDSLSATLTETDIIKDAIKLYKWLNLQAKEIFVWGHSLGGALSARIISELNGIGTKPMGLVLEAPFTTFSEQFEHTTIADIYSWLLWYDATIVDPLYKNGFQFETIEHILTVNCPIMVLHAEDDDFTLFSLGEKLVKIAQENRNDTQGSITFYSFPAHFGYNHWRIHEAPELPNYIKDHIDICRKYNNTIS